jgi:predicted DNA-binding transcriptional regulator YafY
MSRPTTRVLAVLEVLQANGTTSGAELARRLGVGRRTVRRYIAALEELGIPIAAERGREGGYLLVAGFKLPPMMFTEDEALALSIGLLAARGVGLAAAEPAVASAQAKLERVMPASLRSRVRAVDETVALDFSRPAAFDSGSARGKESGSDGRGGNGRSDGVGDGSGARNDSASGGRGGVGRGAKGSGGLDSGGGGNAALVALTAAAQAGRRVHLEYAAARGEATERDFDPYGLAYRGGAWYVVGHCHLRGGLRSFRLDRVRSVRQLAATFLRPPGFDTVGHLTSALATLPRAFAVEVLLATDLATARRAVVPSAGVLESTGEGVLLHSQADNLEWIARELARLPFPFRVLHPPALRTVLAAHARRLLTCAGTVEPDAAA